MATEDIHTILISHPSSDLYGSDLQLLESIEALVGLGYKVCVVLPAEGALEAHIQDRGASVTVAEFPVSRKALLNVKKLPFYVLGTIKAVITMSRLVRRMRPVVIYANTLTAPVWFVVGRLNRIPVMCHVHEAEDSTRRIVGLMLISPLMFCSTIVVNSQASKRIIERTIPRLSGRTRLIYNGIANSGVKPSSVEAPDRDPVRLVLVGRVSPRKGTDIALEATGHLVARGMNVELVLCGTAFDGYEWFERECKNRALQDDLQGRIRFAGYVVDVQREMERSHIVLVPSRAEPFGNVAVEAQLANRPLVASNVQGLAEIVTDGETGVLCDVGDSEAVADAVMRLVANWESAKEIADNGYRSAVHRFGVQRYRDEIGQVALMMHNPGNEMPQFSVGAVQGGLP